MDIIVRGRNVEIPDHYRVHVAEKLERIERYDSKLMRVDVELTHENNKRQSANCQHVEITLRSKGPVVRGEACAENFYAALDAAVTKLESRLRRSADRKRVSYGRHAAPSLATAAGDGFVEEPEAADGIEAEADNLPGRVVREKLHPDTPMSVDEALHNMELVGHDFYLFLCAETHQPTVVYRRHAYDYGLIRLAPVGATTSEGDQPADATSDSPGAAEPVGAR